MSTSGTTSFNQTRDQIITKALILIGAVGVEDSINASDISYCSDMLNILLDEIQAEGTGLWLQQEATLFLDTGVAAYSLANGAHASNTVVETTLSASAAISASTVTLTTVTGITIGDVIGIVLDSLTTQWTTITNIVGSVVTLTATLTGAATSGNRVYTYTTAVSRPVQITQARLRNSGDTDVELTRDMREDYFSRPNKATVGTPTEYYYDSQLNSGTIYLWVTPSSPNFRVKFTYRRRIQDVGVSSNTEEIPPEWLLALIYNLAAIIAPAYGKDTKAAQTIVPLAEKYLQKLKSFDIDQGSIHFIPDTGP